MKLWKTLFALSLAVVLFVTEARPAAAHGFPPFGAWVYGSGAPTSFRTRTVVRSRPSFCYGWGGYGNVGFSATTRIRSRGFYPGYANFSYRVGYPSYYTYRPITYRYAFPSVYYYPTYTYPVYYPIHTFVPAFPTCSIGTTNLNFAASLPTLVQKTSLPTGVTISNTAQSNWNLVGTQPQTQTPPQDLLDAADAILAAGGYSEAAKAYAQLTLRFGSSQELLERRFVSQILNRQFMQAEVVLQLAELGDKQLSGGSLGNDGLPGLVQSPVILDAATEALAQHALGNTKDAVALRTVATWLTMCGKEEKSQVFLTAAAELEPTSNLELPAQSMIANKQSSDSVRTVSTQRDSAQPLPAMTEQRAKLVFIDK